MRLDGVAKEVRGGEAWFLGATRLYERLLQLMFALVPSAAIAYLYFYQFPDLCETHHGFHEMVIGLAILVGCFVSYVTWRCYLSSGEPFLRWLTLGFLGFTIIYAPHGFFTPLAEEQLWLFIIHGPASRLVMLACLLVGLCCYGQDAHDPELRRDGWLGWIALFLGINMLLALIAWTPLGQDGLGTAIRVGMEGGALLLGLLGVGVILLRRIQAPLIQAYAISLLIFVQSSLAFMLAKPWNHMWWLGHAIFAGGFFFLSYWVVLAFHSTRAFSKVYSQEEIMEQLRQAKEDAEGALAQLEKTNVELERLASTDPLTGAANRRAFMERSRAELARSGRSAETTALLLLDLDHFKAINDSYGHQGGDAVLKAVVAEVQAVLRPSDLMGRVGGEEFMVLLPDADAAAALGVADRILQRVADLQVPSNSGPIRLTLSMGLAVFPLDGGSLEQLFKVADLRLYEAKHQGRNRVVAVTPPG